MSTFTQNIDATAEAEGLAEERLAELLGTEVPETRLQIALGQARAAAARGIQPAKVPGYSWAESCRVHDWLNRRASWPRIVWGPPDSRKLPARFDDPKRRSEKRLRRAALLVQLQRLPKRQALDIDTAARCSGLGVRTLERAIENGRIGARIGKRRIVRAGELHRLLAAKLAGRPVAA